MSVPAHIQSFVTDFYAKSDARDKEAWVNCFTPDANLDMTGKVGKGSEAIGKVCEGVWVGVDRREHHVDGIYINPKNENDAVLLGSIDVDRADGIKVRGIQWGARMQLEGGKLADYKVWLLSPPPAPK